MSIKIYSSKTGYYFGIDDVFKSNLHYYLIPNIRSNYSHLWKAYHDASKVSKYHIDAMKKYSSEDLSKPVAVDMSAEEMLTHHYSDILDIMLERAKNSEKTKDESDAIYKEIKDVRMEISTILGNITDEKDKKKLKQLSKSFNSVLKKYFPKRFAKEQMEEKNKPSTATPQPTMPMPPSVPPMPGGSDLMPMSSIMTSMIASEMRKEVLSDYAEKICFAIQNIHRNFFYKIIDKSLSIIIMSVSHKKTSPILKIQINDHLVMTDIVPMGDISRMYPYHSPMFYQRYWKPIVEEVGHILIQDFPFLIYSRDGLPDIPLNSDLICSVEGWDVSKNTNGELDFVFKNNLVWLIQKHSRKSIKEASSKYTELDYRDAMVKCIDPTLKTLFGKIGEVIQVIPLADTVQLDVDFGRQIIRITEPQIEIVKGA